MTKYTVLGGSGFVGSEVVTKLRTLGHEVFAPERGDIGIYNQNLGIVIYCSGYGDCENSPFDVFYANSELLAKILTTAKFERFVYISSTRVYMNNNSSLEKADLNVVYSDNRRLFNLTKLVSEELCLNSKRDVVIIRPSNIYGLALNSPLFLPSITRNAINHGVIDMYVDKKYAKDYVLVSDVADVCIALSLKDDAKGQIYNVASGINVTAEDIAEILKVKTGCNVIWHQPNKNKETFPLTDITKLRTALPDYQPSSVLKDLSNLIERFSKEMRKRDESYS